ncbi:hypothetical protein BX600DRAFT_484365 [Xylariales sp. PMI_506]|nr:hypothetical protein BX600DRAFT_484365 [Xylariales sp. PMI_506]
MGSVPLSPNSDPSRRYSTNRERTTATSPEQDDLLEAGRLYLIWCHRQPLTLFQRESFLQSLRFRDRELILAIQALSLRFAPGQLGYQSSKLRSMAKASRDLVMGRLTEGQIELSTLQTLCLLAFLDFTDGKSARGAMDLSIAMHLVHSLTRDSRRSSSLLVNNHEEFRDCHMCILKLQNLQTPIFSVEVLTSNGGCHQSDRIQKLLNRPSNHLRSNDVSANFSGIHLYTAELTDAWYMARAYAARLPDSETPPPWTPNSDYQIVTLRYLEIDSRVPLKYRFEANRIEDQDPEALQQHRDYWGPWLFLMVVFSAIPCLLNHPFLLSMRLRHFRHSLPHSFIQSSFEQITRHAGWICHFIDVVEQKQFVISDPTIAHCVAIVATIHLQHSFVKDHSLRDKAQIGFEKCMNLLRRIATTWPNVESMVDNLDRLRASITLISSPMGVGGGEARQTWSIDAQLLWDILIYEKAGQPFCRDDRSIFGETLMRTRSDSVQDTIATGSEAEFDLIGTAGIYGHRAVPKQTPLYAPTENAIPLAKAGYAPHKILAWAGSETTPESAHIRAMGGSSGQDNMFLCADEYGKAIENWLDFDALR